MSTWIPATFQSEQEARDHGYIPKDTAARIAALNPATLLNKARNGTAPTPVHVAHSGYWWEEKTLFEWALSIPRRQRPIGPVRKCSAEGCMRAEWARGLCNTHYARLHTSGVVQEHHVGDPVHTGYWGIVDENDEGVLCYECGKRFQSLGTHLPGAHGMKAKAYKDKYGIPRGRSLSIKKLRDANKRRALEKRLAKNLETTRDPYRALEARTPESIKAAGRTHRQRGLDR